MVVHAPTICRSEPWFHGVRMTAEEYFQTPDDGYKYELLDGVMMMSPSPTPQHQAVLVEILSQISIFLRTHPVGHVLAETDIQLGPNEAGRDIVYRPEIVFLRTERLASVRKRIVGAPDLAVEIISPESRRYDSETKKGDYEKYGVGEFWLIDPERDAMTFYRRQGERLVEVPPAGEAFHSEAVPGFALDLVRVRKSFRPW